jgi:hypothetical protein
MTDDPTRPDLTPDELASARVDGLATPEQVAQIEADPDLRARVARLEAARDAVRVPDLPPDEDRRQAAIAAALGAAELPAGAQVVALASRRSATRRLRWAAAAAAAVAIALVLPRLLDRDSGSADTSVAAAPKSSSDEGSAERNQTADADTFESAAGAAGAAPDVGSTTTAARGVEQYSCCPLRFLGGARDLAQLATDARKVIDSEPDAFSPGDPPFVPDDAQAECLARLASIGTAPASDGDPAGQVLLSAYGSVDGREVLLQVVAHASGDRELVAGTLDTCELLGTVGL